MVFSVVVQIVVHVWSVVKGSLRYLLAANVTNITADIVGMDIDGEIKQAIKEVHALSVMEPNLGVVGMLNVVWQEFEQKKDQKTGIKSLIMCIHA